LEITIRLASPAVAYEWRARPAVEKALEAGGASDVADGRNFQREL
jgi:hypothetical protein